MHIDFRKKLALVAASAGAFIAHDDAFAQLSLPQREHSQSQLHIHKSDNFIVHSESAEVSREFCAESERIRDELSKRWFNKKIPMWKKKCSITINFSNKTHGETIIEFSKDFNIHKIETSVYGTSDSIKKNSLPHEINHAIMMMHFKKSIPLWLTEGMATVSESPQEKDRYQKILYRSMRAKPLESIPFNKMFTLNKLPHNPLPLYAQSCSLTEFLLLQGNSKENSGEQKLIKFLEDILDHQINGTTFDKGFKSSKLWDAAIKKHYNYTDLSDLQTQWLKWAVKNE